MVCEQHVRLDYNCECTYLLQTGSHSYNRKIIKPTNYLITHIAIHSYLKGIEYNLSKVCVVYGLYSK